VGKLEELAFSIGRIVLGVIVLIGLFIALDLIVYISNTGSTSSEKIAAAYDGGYSQGYDQTYKVRYQEGYGEAYDKGYNKGYEIGQGSGSKQEVATRVELRNPTYKELREFLAGDKTDFNLFIRGEHVCFDFAAELNNSAEANSLRAAYVRIRFEKWGHAVVAFETVDRGLVFIEPQTDRNVEELVVGKPYPWHQVGASRSADYDDTIVEIQIIW